MGEEEKSIFQAIKTVCRISVIQWLDQICVLRERERLGTSGGGGGERQNKMKLLLFLKSFCVVKCVFKGPTRVFVPWQVRKSSLKQHYLRYNRRLVFFFQGLYFK